MSSSSSLHGSAWWSAGGAARLRLLAVLLLVAAPVGFRIAGCGGGGGGRRLLTGTAPAASHTVTALLDATRLPVDGSGGAPGAVRLATADGRRFTVNRRGGAGTAAGGAGGLFEVLAPASTIDAGGPGAVLVTTTGGGAGEGGLSLSWRVCDDVFTYVLAAATDLGAPAVRRAMDQQLRQRVLPTLLDGRALLPGGLVEELVASWRLVADGPEGAADLLARAASLQAATGAPSPSGP